MQKHKENPSFKGNTLLIAFWDEYSIQNWFDPLKKLFNRIILFEPKKERINYGQEKMNQHLLEKVRKENPDYILLNMISDEIPLGVLEKIKEVSPQTKLINFSGDDDYQFESYSSYLSLFVDAQIIYQREYLKKYKENGFQNAYVSIGVNLDQYKPLKLEKKYEVSFIGAPRNDRSEFIRYLINKRIKVNLWGAGWEKYPEFKEYWGGYLNSTDLIKIINQSKINLSFNKGGVGKGQFHLTGRVFEIASCNSFQLAEDYYEYHKFFKPEKEMVYFKTNEDLLKKINHYIKHEKEREDIAQRAYRKIVQKYDRFYELNEIFNDLSKKEGKKITWKEKEEDILTITAQDLKKDILYLKEKAKNASFIQFSLENCQFSRYKSALQKKSLILSKKDISCCDYYIKDPLLGNYTLCKTKNAFYTLKKEDFAKLISLDQLMVTSKYFFKNLSKLIKMYQLKKNIEPSKEEVVFLSFPLVIRRSISKINVKEMKKCFEPRFMYLLSSSIKAKSPLFLFHLSLLLAKSLTKSKYIGSSLIDYTKKSALGRYIPFI